MKTRRGFMLIEVLIALVVAGILLFFQMRESANALIDEAATFQGTQLKRLAEGVDAYAVTYNNELVNSLPVGGVAIPLQPTVVELVALGYLSPNFNAVPVSGGVYQVNLSLTPAACTPGTNCNIGGYANISQPFLIAGVVNPRAIGKAVAVGGSDLGASMISGATINGLNGGWSIPNPVAGIPLGILAARLGAESALFSQFLRRDGSLPMTGNLAMGGNSLTAANNVTATGTVQGDNVTGLTSVRANNNFALNGTQIVDSARNLTNIQDAAIAGTVTVAATGDIVMNSLPHAGAVKSIANYLPRLVEKGSFLVQHGGNIPVPACPNGGVPQVFLIPGSFASVAGGYIFSAIGAGPWTASLLDSTLTPLPPPQAALARTFCNY